MTVKRAMGKRPRRSRAQPSRLAWASVAVGGWGLCYALYRGYYAAGGTAFLPGRPADPNQFRMINAAAVIILLLAAALPVAALPLWSRPWARPVLLAVYWVIAVGCGTHALVDAIQRVLSLAGLLDVRYPSSVWASIDTRAADLQDLFFNEPWFMLEGLGFAALAWIALGVGPGRRAWIGSALAATGVLTVVGLLVAAGAIGRLIIG
jgi:hypothetical protein